MSDDYRYQSTNDFEKLLEQEGIKNISKVATLILLTIGMYISPTRLLKVNPPNVEYDLEERLHEGCIGVDWSDEGEIAVVMAVGNNKVNDDKDPQEKTR